MLQRIITAALLSGAFAIGLLAAPIAGTFNLDGIVTISPTGMTWNSALAPNASDQATLSTPTGSFTGLGSNTVTINNLNFAAQPVGTPFAAYNFIDFLSSPTYPSLDANSIPAGPYTAAGCTASPVATGQTCTPSGSPIGFLNTTVGSTATWVISGVTSDGLSNWSGVFTAQFNMPFQTVLTDMEMNGSATDTYSATVTVTQTPTTIIKQCTYAQLQSAVSAGGLIILECNGTIPITSTLTISANTTIDATGYTVALDGGNANEVFLVNPGLTLALNNLTIQNGNNTGGPGGAIYNAGTLIVTNSTFSSNQVGSGPGGAIYNAGTAIVTNSTFSSNHVGFAAGGAIYNSGDLIATNSTFSSNQAFEGGAIYNQGGTALIANSTFLANGAGGGGGGIFGDGGTATLQNNILAGATSGSECGFATLTTLTDGGYNLSDDNSCQFSAAGSQNSVPDSGVNGLNLGSLGNYGGPTQTVNLTSTSIAIGAIPAGTNGCATSIAMDQRGVARPGDTNGNCSIGAYEYVAPVAATITNCTNDSQLQSAVSTGGRIVFACSGDILLSGTLNIAGNTTLDATGQIVALDGGGSKQILSNSSSVLTLNNLTVQNGNSATNGGAIFNEATLIVTNSAFSNNSAPSGAGGAILSSGSTAIVTNSTFSTNSANEGGAIWSNDSFITNSTFFNNSATSSGGGGAFFNGYRAHITNSTFSNNSAPSGTGGAVFNDNLAIFENTILAGSATKGGECSGNPFTDGGYNLDDDGSCGFSSAKNSFSDNQNANLGSLSYNGGPTLTIPLNTGSTALGAIPVGSSGCGALASNVGTPILTDERGVFRPQLACDMGALQTAQNQVLVTFNTSPANLTYDIGPLSYSSQKILALPVDTLSTIWAPSPQSATATQYTFASWSDSLVDAHQITISPALTSDTANFTTSYLLTTAVNPPGAGTVSISASETGNSGYYPAGTEITLTANPAAGYVFSGWTGTTSSATNPLTFALNSPVTETANFLLATTTIGTVSESPSVYGDPVELIAYVSNGTSTPPNGGTVTFKMGSTIVGSGTVSHGVASYSMNGLQVSAGGNPTIAYYSGDSTDAPSQSVSFEFLVIAANTTTTVTYSPIPAVHNKNLTLTATVKPQYGGTPTGTVTFTENGGTPVTVMLVNGTASYSFDPSQAGTFTITAVYNPPVNGNFNVSSGSVRLTIQ